MTIAEIDTIKRELAEINSFVRERFDPVSSSVDLLREETERLERSVLELQQRDRAVRRESLMRQAGDDSPLTVPEGPYAGMDVLDLALLRRFAYSQRREAFGPAWLERTEEAKRMLADGATPAAVQETHRSSARKLSAWHRVGRRSTGQFESFSRPVLQSMTRAAMDSTTAGSGDELVATLEARELWMDVHLQTLVAPLVPTINMPSSPFDIPRQLGDVSFYPGTENVAPTSTALGTSKTAMTAHELVGRVPYSFTLEEDAVIALLPEIRGGGWSATWRRRWTTSSSTPTPRPRITSTPTAPPSRPATRGKATGCWDTTASSTCPSWTTPPSPTTTAPPSPMTCSTRYGPSWASTASAPLSWYG